jgi:hypothetical protein
LTVIERLSSLRGGASAWMGFAISQH